MHRFSPPVKLGPLLAILLNPSKLLPHLYKKSFYFVFILLILELDFLENELLEFLEVFLRLFYQFFVNVLVKLVLGFGSQVGHKVDGVFLLGWDLCQRHGWYSTGVRGWRLTWDHVHNVIPLVFYLLVISLFQLTSTPVMFESFILTFLTALIFDRLLQNFADRMRNLIVGHL